MSTLKRTFSPNGNVNPDAHFFVDPSPWNEESLIPSLLKGSFSALIAPSQTGKTTRVSSMINKINTQEKDVICVYLDMSVIVENNGLFKDKFLERFIHVIERITSTTIDLQLDEWENLFSLESSAKWFGNKQIILILDEVDCLAKAKTDERSAFLSHLGFLKLNQAKPPLHCLRSVLIITNCTGSYLTDMFGNSPFNTIDQLTAPYFTLEEVQELFQQYQKEYEISISPSIINYIYKQTDGAQGLTVMYGKSLHAWIQMNHKIPSYNDWVNYTFTSEFFNTICGFPNYQKMSALIENDKSATDILLRFIYEHHDRMIPESLIRTNILLSNGKFSNPFTKRLVSAMLNPNSRVAKREQIGLDQNLEQIDFVDLVCKTVRNINPLVIMTAGKRSTNYISSTLPPGPKESVYVWSFKKALDITFHDTLMTVFPEVAAGSKSWDMVLQMLGQTIAVKHGANLNLDKNSTSNKSVFHYVKKQEESNHTEKTTNQTWVINWTTVQNSPTFPYYFPQSDTVRTIYIYHDSIFSQLIVSTSTNNHHTIEIPNFYFGLKNDTQLSPSKKKTKYTHKIFIPLPTEIHSSTHKNLHRSSGNININGIEFNKIDFTKWTKDNIKILLSTPKSEGGIGISQKRMKNIDVEGSDFENVIDSLIKFNGDEESKIKHAKESLSDNVEKTVAESIVRWTYQNLLA